MRLSLESAQADLAHWWQRLQSPAMRWNDSGLCAATHKLLVFYLGLSVKALSPAGFYCGLGEPTNIMTFTIPEAAIVHGFRLKPGGAHASKSMMLPEVRLLFRASTPVTDYDELGRLAVEDNVVLKGTLSNREDVFKRLAELYGLRQELRLYRALRALWDTGEQEQPLLAVLCALARDPLLRSTASAVLDQPVGAVVPTPSLEAAIETAFPRKYSAKTRLSMSQNTGASWAQSGHLVGKAGKVRHKVAAGPASAAYALLLGYLCGARGALLYETGWAAVLDTPPGALDSLAFAASQRGWVDYRRVGTVVEIGFSHLMSL